MHSTTGRHCAEAAAGEVSGGPRKLILKCGLSPGDIVMLTAAVRDLHLCYPGRFITDVRTPCPEIWDHNPYLTPLCSGDAGVGEIDCSYPLIHRCNSAPYHCLHGFIEFLNERLHLSIKPTLFRGDIHLSALEKSWFSQVRELTGEDTPFWIIAAGGKYDVTIKWWERERYQAVVDHFRGRIQFVQVGAWGHHHPKLEGVIDLRGKTDLRQLIRLVYNSQGILCSVTALMHLAAAVESRTRGVSHRPCVVIAGGREPVHWEAYPGHQFIHTEGVLACCSSGGCWKDRIVPLRDGDTRDRPQNLCADVVGGLPHCMHLISPAEVARRVELFFHHGRIPFLKPSQAVAAARAVKVSARNRYDAQPLNLHIAALACERFISTIRKCPPLEGRGIVICIRDDKLITKARACIKRLRRLGCALPIQLWHLGQKGIEAAFPDSLRVTCIDGVQIRKSHPVRRLNGCELKPYSVLHSPFWEVLLLDPDQMPARDPSYLFETGEFRRTGALFWPGCTAANPGKAMPIWRSAGLRQKQEPPFDTSQVLLDKSRCWRALCLTMWFNEHSDFFYHYLDDERETFHLAFRKVGKSYSWGRRR